MKTAMKHINAIFAGVMFICLLLPHLTASVSFMGQSKSESKNFFWILENGDNDLWCYLVVLGIVALAAASYIKQIAAYVKYINLGAAAVVLLSAFLSLNDMTGKEMGVEVSRGIGSWLLIIVAIAAVAVAVIKMLGAKGNPVFDAINED